MFSVCVLQRRATALDCLKAPWLSETSACSAATSPSSSSKVTRHESLEGEEVDEREAAVSVAVAPAPRKNEVEAGKKRLINKTAERLATSAATKVISGYTTD